MITSMSLYQFLDCGIRLLPERTIPKATKHTSPVFPSQLMNRQGSVWPRRRAASTFIRGLRYTSTMPSDNFSGRRMATDGLATLDDSKWRWFRDRGLVKLHVRRDDLLGCHDLDGVTAESLAKSRCLSGCCPSKVLESFLLLMLSRSYHESA